MEQWRIELYHSELYHHGVKGMKWGRRRYQNEDGTLTAEGRRHLGYSSSTTKKYRSEYGSDSEKYKKSASLDRKIGKKMLDDRTTNRGHMIAKNILFGPTGTMTYDMARAVGYSKGRSAVKAIFDINVGNIAEVATARGVHAVLSSSYVGAPGERKVAASLAARGASHVVGTKIRDTGNELSLQQRAIRKKYVNGNSRSRGKVQSPAQVMRDVKRVSEIKSNRKRQSTMSSDEYTYKKKKKKKSA